MTADGQTHEPAGAAAVPQKLVGIAATVDLHADTAMHGRPLDSAEDRPGLLMRMWMWLVGLFVPNYFRHVTRQTLDRWGCGVQIFSVTTEGLPPLFRASHRFYTQVAVGRPPHANASRFNTFIDQVAWIFAETQKHGQRLRLVANWQQAVAALSEDRVGAMIAVEGAQVLVPKPADEARLSRFLRHPGVQLPSHMPLPGPEDIASVEGRIRYLSRIGTLYVGLTHCDNSDYAGSSSALGARRGLAKEGRKLVRQLNEAGILIDLAHASEQTERDVAGLCDLPVIVSHGVLCTGTRDAPKWRDTSPETLEEIRRTGGLFGVMLATLYLNDGTIADVVDQMDCVRDAIGIDYLAYGSDADGFVNLVVPDLGSLGDIEDEMVRRGYTADQLAKIRYENFLRMLKRRDDVLAWRGSRAGVCALERDPEAGPPIGSSGPLQRRSPL